MRVLNRDIIASLCFFFVSFFILYNFVIIMVNGRAIIGFENLALNLFELLVALAFVSFALERFIHHGKRVKSPSSK